MTCPKCQLPIGEDSRFCSRCGASVPSSDDTYTRTILRESAGEPVPEMVVGARYRIVEVLGRGGMGVVYKADDTKLHRAVALKFLPPEFAASPELRERFLIEARAAAALSHSHICTIHEIYDDEARPFIEMEYIQGRSLRALLEQRALEAGEAAAIALQLAEGLAEAHRKGVIHRDIKSANVMVTEDGQAKIMDFGLAKVQGESFITRDGATLGTAAYMSPEQARGAPVDGRTDLWSLGVVLYEMLNRRLPFSGERQTTLLYAVVHEEPLPMEPGVPAGLRAIVNRALQKDVQARYASAAEMATDLRRYLDTSRKPAFVFPHAKAFTIAAAVLLLSCAAGAWWLHRNSRIRWAREQALPEIERLLLANGGGNLDAADAYSVAAKAEKYIAGDPRLAALMERCSVRIDVETEPAGADVSFRHIWASEKAWQHVGRSPLSKVRVPAGTFIWKIEKPGYETVIAVSPTYRFDRSTRTRIAPRDFYRVLDLSGKLPPGMVRVSLPASQKVPSFFIDKFEVTNRQYKEFIDAGGYRNRKYWTQEFVRDGKTLAWETAMAEFVDSTGRPGPSTWTAGEPLAGQENYPVSGVSWYEAAAYSEFRGKTLPVAVLWGVAAGVGSFPMAWLARSSNIGTAGPAPVGSHPGMTAFGAYDMAGNVREWCWNAAENGKVVRGGAWSDAAYMFGSVNQAQPFDRSSRNGFRCAMYLDKIPPALFAPWSRPEAPDFTKVRPVDDAIFEVYKARFSYDRKPLNPRTEFRTETAPGWIQEKVVVDAAYENETLPIHLFLPRNSRPPYQTVIYFPGTQATYLPSSKDLDQYYEFQSFLSYVLKNGRAALFPVYKGTFERRLPISDQDRPTTESRQFLDLTIKMVQDLRTSLDYLESRPDIDSKRVAYLGYSWGGILGAHIPAVENRLRASILVVGGLPPSTGVPELNPVHYLPRVKVPTLMLNGRYDLIEPFETNVKPMFELLGTSPAEKKLVVYDTDHFIPHNELIRETLAWLDRYLGPVE